MLIHLDNSSCLQTNKQVSWNEQGTILKWPVSDFTLPCCCFLCFCFIIVVVVVCLARHTLGMHTKTSLKQILTKSPVSFFGGPL